MKHIKSSINPILTIAISIVLFLLPSGCCLLPACFLSSSGCCDKPHRSFELVDKKHIVKPGSLAVLSGTKKKLDTILAASVTKELRQQGMFRVMTQQEIAKQLPNYPYSLIQTAASDASENYSASKTLVDIAQKRLKTTYIFIVWTEDLKKRTLKGYYGAPLQDTYYSHIAGNFFEYPRAVLTGTALFQTQGGRSMLHGEPEVDVIEAMIEGAGKEMVDYFLRVVKQ